MSTWSINFIIQNVRSEERINNKREVVKNETIVNIEIEDTDLNIMLNCKDGNSKFSHEELLKSDRENILKDEIKENMIKDYYVSSFKLDFTNKTGEVKLSYPKINLI